MRNDAPLNNLHCDRLTLSQAIANFIHYLKEAIAAYHNTRKKLEQLSPKAISNIRTYRSALWTWAVSAGHADRSFDLAFLGHVLYEADDPLAALKESHRLARYRMAILEWPYRQGEKGPPLEHRLRPETVTDLATRAGFQNVETIHLERMDIYRLTP